MSPDKPRLNQLAYIAIKYTPNIQILLAARFEH